MYYKCTPTSKKKLRDLAKKIRAYYNIKNISFPIYQILEKNFDDGTLIYEVVEENDKRLGENELALYLPDYQKMLIKESVYLEMLNGIGRSRFTITHEYAHYVLLTLLDFKVEQTTEKPEAYCNPEWQANTLAAELLCPYEETKDYTLNELITKCNISEECAIIILKLRNKLQLEGKI